MGAISSVLAVDDQPRFLDAVTWTLEAAGYRVLTARDGIEAVSILESQAVDLILADIVMPRMNGYQLFQRVVGHSDWITIPFVFVTGRGMDSDVRYGKSMGVDDYLVKPIDPQDLLAAVRGKLRKAKRLKEKRDKATAGDQRDREPHSDADTLVLGALRINADQYRVWMEGACVDLSTTEFVLLYRLAQDAESVVSHEALIKATHGLDTDRQEAGRLLRPLIRSLRRKLGYPVGDMGCIENVRGVGYMLLAPTNGTRPPARAASSSS